MQTPPDAPRFRLPMEVEVGDLTLRRLTEADERDLFLTVSASLDHLRPYMEWTQNFSQATIREFIAKAGAVDDRPVSDAPYVVRSRGTLLGTCGLHARLGPHGLEIGYWVAAAHVRRGVASIASAALTEVAFTCAEVHFVEIHHDSSNVASAGVPAKLGYERVGHALVAQDVPAATGEHWIWRMTREAWPTSAGAHLLGSAARPGG